MTANPSLFPPVLCRLSPLKGSPRTPAAVSFDNARFAAGLVPAVFSSPWYSSLMGAKPLLKESAAAGLVPSPSRAAAFFCELVTPAARPSDVLRVRANGVAACVGDMPPLRWLAPFFFACLLRV